MIYLCYRAYCPLRRFTRIGEKQLNDNNKNADVTTEETPLSAHEKGQNSRRPERPKKDKFAINKDIWYRGPLSYTHLKMLGWLCIVITQIAIVEGLKFKVTGSANEFFLNSEVISFISASALPLLLISIFAFLLQKRDNYKNTLIVYGALSLLIIAIFVFIYERYVLGLAGSLLGGERSDLAQRLDDLLYSTGEYNGFVTFNIFIDVFLCTLIMFFLDHEPKHFFTGKKLWIFRAFVLLPIAYESVCIILKIMATDRIISLPLWVSPLLTTKPPVSVLMFFSVVRYIKRRETQFYATGRTKEQYNAFVDTNVNSFQFAKHLVLIIIIYSIIDFIVTVLLTVTHSLFIYSVTGVRSGEDMMSSFGVVKAWGFGETVKMLDLIPVVLLFSYTRSHKLPLIDIAIPVVAVAAIAIVYLDGAFQIVQGVISNGTGFSAGLSVMPGA